MFFGQYHHQLDDKGRFRIPTKFREQLGPNPMMVYGVEGCIQLFRAEDFDEVVKKRFANSDGLDIKTSDIMRVVLPLTQEAEIDKQGRTAINPTLMAKCGMSKNIISIGLMNRVEIWDEDRYAEHMDALDVKAILELFSER